MSDNMLFDLGFEEKKTRPVKCLKIEFENDEARRAYFTEELRKKLKDPDFRNTEGFPIGSDENILALSDPPYYTACPNPFFELFLQKNQEQDNQDIYHCTPFAIEVPEKRHDPVGLAHTYHTKISHNTIAEMVSHYTRPGDLILDCFSGSGMTAIGTIIANNDKSSPTRSCIELDLSPAASLLSYSYSKKTNPYRFKMAVERILSEIENELGWMYKYQHSGKELFLSSLVWCEVYNCDVCGAEIIPWDSDEQKSVSKIDCKECGKNYESLDGLNRIMENYFDPILKVPRIRTKRKSVLIKLKPLAGTRNTIVQPDKCAHPDSERINKYIEEVTIAHIKIPYMHMTHERNPLPSQGIEYVHDLFSTRNTIFIHRAFEMVLKEPASVRYSLWMWINSALQKMSLLMCYNNDGIGRVLKGVYYVPRIGLEASPLHYLRVAARDVFKLLSYISEKRGDVIVGTGSAKSIQLPNSSVDYIFIDPPFGGFQLYSDLNFLWESFIKVFTNRHDEVIVDQVQDKGVGEYHDLIRDSFKECYRVLKSGHWMTLKFHNSSSTIWHTIQNSLYEAGFIVANVSASDKKLGTTKQISDASTVRQDLIISVYKPLEVLEERSRLDIGNESSAWNFIRAHLENLPIIAIKGKKLEVVSERTEYLLYDRMVAFHIQRGLTVPLSSVEFFTGLSERFAERDGMYFLPNQAVEYDKKRLSVENVEQLKLFVSDESSARQWLREQIRQKPQTFQELHPQFMKEIGGWSKTEKPLELSTLLEQNFLSYNGKGPVPEQIHAYLSTNWKELRNLPKDDPTLVAKARNRWYLPDPNKAGDLEKLREKALLKEFEEYKEVKKKLKVFRLEAVRAGFKKAWQERDYAVIVAVADKIPNNVLEEDPKLLMWYDQAVTRMGGE